MCPSLCWASNHPGEYFQNAEGMELQRDPGNQISKRLWSTGSEPLPCVFPWAVPNVHRSCQKRSPQESFTELGCPQKHKDTPFHPTPVGDKEEIGELSDMMMSMKQSSQDHWELPFPWLLPSHKRNHQTVEFSVAGKVTARVPDCRLPFTRELSSKEPAVFLGWSISASSLID